MTNAVVAPLVEGPDVTRQGLNLADGSLGAEVVRVTDEFFAPRERMLNPEQPVFYPDRYDNPQSLITQSMFWRTLLNEQPLTADSIHQFSELNDPGPITHIRFNMIPDGGVSRVRLFGKPVS